jgi:hypothetical protein
MKRETGSEMNVYKQLAQLGIEARFSCLQGINGMKAESAVLSLSEEITRTDVLPRGDKQVEEILNKMNLFSEKMDEVLKKLNQHLSRVEQGFSQSPEKVVETKALPINVTVFKVDERFFGVESNKGETNILTVREDGQYKGLIVDQVLKQLSTPTEIGRGYGDYFVGMIRWTYQGHSVEIPILDLKKF